MQNKPVWMDFAQAGTAILAAGFVSTTLLSPTVSVLEKRPVGMSASAQTKLEQVAGASLFGQFRSSMADFLYMKVDKYLHNGVELRGVTEQEKQVNVTEAQTAKGDTGFAQHESETTIVPNAKDDWRGVLGAIERETQPYVDMSAHVHRDPKEALPLFRLMTASNPQFIPGYVVGAAMIARDKTKRAEALAFLREGEVNNPESIEIKAEIGMFYNGKLRQFAAAEKPLVEALVLAAGRDPKSLTDDEKEAWQNAVRHMVLCFRYQGKRDEAHQAAVDGLRLFPGDVTCLKQLKIERTGEWRKYIER